MKVEKIHIGRKNSLSTLTTYILDDSPEMLKGQSRPAIIICPGGGFFSCSDREAEPVAMYFAAQGYQSFVLRYTTYFSGELQMPDLSQPLPVKKDTIFPIQIHELGQAMLLIKENAVAWHVDPQKIGVCGFSAGGNVAALYATRYNEPILTDYLQTTAKNLRPAFAIVGYGLTDYHLLNKQLSTKSNDPGGQAFMKASNIAYTGLELPDENLEREISPVEHVDADTPPFFIWTTATDPLVSPIHSLYLATALAEQGISYEIHIFSQGTHGLSLGTQATADSRSQIVPSVSQWTVMCTKWLEQNFALKLPEKSLFEEMKEKEEKNVKF